MNKKKIILLIYLMLLLSLMIYRPLEVYAGTPYVTQTTDRYGKLVGTQEAYESILKIKTIKLLAPKGMFIDQDDYLYIADTGNKRIVIIDQKYDLVLEFGTDLLLQPKGIYVRDDLIYIADYGSNEDNTTGAIIIYRFDKSTNTVTFVEKRSTPISNVLAIDNFIYRPEKIAVDSNKTMYVVSEGSYNGILMISDSNRFMSYFSPNTVSTSIKDRITKFLYGDNEDVTLTKNLPPPPFNVTIDDSGYIYTITQTIVKNSIGDTLKKVNIGGVNFYPAEMQTTGDFTSSWSGSVGNIFAVSKNGFIYEYDQEGNLLFMFAGKSNGSDQLGLFNSASSIVVNSKDQLIVLDDNDNSFQIFKPTEFANKVHEALSYYNAGRYIECKEIWVEVLRYNAFFDLAHKGIGLAYFLENDFEHALEKFELANAKEEYSDAYWEIRNIWLTTNVGYVIIIIIVLLVIILTLKILNRKTKIFNKFKEKFHKFRNSKIVSDFLLLFGCLRHPLDTTYKLKTDKTISIWNGFIFLIIIFGIYIVSLTSTGFLFNDVVLEETELLREAMRIVIPIVAFIIANYLAASLLDGEGRFRSILLSTMASLAPIVIMFPFIILISNVLTYNESFIYDFGLIVMLGWSLVLLFVTNKELHNYSFKRNLLNFLLTIFLMIILIIIVILVYMIIMQVVSFISDIITEVIFRG